MKSFLQKHHTKDVTKVFKSLSLVALTLGGISMVTAASSAAYGAPTRVGNGDDGGDLEKGTPVTSGILVEARNEAVELLKKLNVAGVSGLGSLLPEVENAKILLVSQNVLIDKTDATPEQIEVAREEARAIGAVNGDDLPVYARTFPEPHAATRFFPAALMLDRRQLVALHIHEALHRALPPAVREDEKLVSRLTLAITSEGSNFDRVQLTANEISKENQSRGSKTNAGDTDSDASLRAKLGLKPEGPLLPRPSVFEYGYRSFLSVDRTKSNAPVESMHSIKSFLYPFGRGADALGLGIEFTYLKMPDQSFLGPLGLSARLKLATWRDFDVDGFAVGHLYTIAANEFKDTPLARDTFTAGLSIRREAKWFKVENQVYVTAGAQAKQTLGKIQYEHEYGSIVAARVSAAAKLPAVAGMSLDLGGMGELLLANPYKVRGGNFEYTSDRTRVVSAGPEVGLTSGALRMAVNGRFVIDSTSGVTLDQLGDLMGQGVGQGSVGGSLSWQF